MDRQGATIRDSSAMAAAVLCCTVLTGCSAPKEIAVGSAPAPTATFAVARPDDTGFVPISAWPQACDLLTEADVQAVLPDVTKVDRKPKGLEMINFDVGAPNRVVTANGALCTMDLWMDGTRDGDDAATVLELRVRMAGTPQRAKSNYEQFLHQVETCPPSAGTIALDACSRSGSSWTFLRNGIAVEFTGYRPGLTDGARYQGQQGDDDAAVWEEQVIPEFVKAVAAKLP